MNDLISVIIPAYNASATLQRCIDSITNNSYRNLEILCINDGSKDNTLDILHDLAQADSRIRVIDQPNGGVSSARNQGLDLATGEYVAFVDSDDWIHRDYFFTMLNTAKKHNADLVVCTYKLVYSLDDSDSERTLDTSVFEPVSMESLKHGNSIVHAPWGRIIKRSLIGELRFPINIHFGEDRIFNVLLYSNYDSLRIYHTNAPCTSTIAIADLFPNGQIRRDSERSLSIFSKIWMA